MTTLTFSRIGRVFRKPPRYIAVRAAAELRIRMERIWGPRRASNFDIGALLRETNSVSLDHLWKRLAAGAYLANTQPVSPDVYEQLCPGDTDRIVRAADAALRHEVNLLGSGPVQLGEHIDWNKDYKSEYDWPDQYFADIDYNNPDRPSDVKFPWEVSRLQWAIPAGQAYLLTGDEKYAAGVRSLLEQWIAANPYAGSVNWGVTMEVALRIFSWTWFFHVFARSESWRAAEFRERFLCALYLHADFTDRHIERADINGNHYTADAAGLVVAGLFFREGAQPRYWAREGWRILIEELPRQVYPDGVDFEMSTAYHRLVMELFLLSAIYRKRCGLDVPDDYQQRVVAMAHFVAAYTKPDGTSPLWGDADDARTLPLGGQALLDHRYLIGLVAAEFAPEMMSCACGPRHEVFWISGADTARKLPATDTPITQPPSSAFRDGGVFIMRNGRDHVFIDCGPVGLAGRGGHGHNDILSFEAVLDGVPLISDCGTLVYTGSYEDRNRFRSTACHNTPQVDGEEVNRFIRPDDLWHLHCDALPHVITWQPTGTEDVFRGSHTGYRRLGQPVRPVRTITLNHAPHSLTVVDDFEGQPMSSVTIPLYLVPGVNTRERADGILLQSGCKQFLLSWTPCNSWRLMIENTQVSPTYGIAVPTTRLSWRSTSPAVSTLKVRVSHLAE